MSVWFDIGLVLGFILVGGMFAAAEIALVSMREGQVKALTNRGDRRGRHIERLTRDPNRYLAAVQVGVTVLGMLSAAVGASTLADRFRPVLESWGLSPRAASTTSFLGVTLTIAYLSLVLGELAPKRLALQRPEPAALLFAPALDRIAGLLRPVIWLLSRSSNLVVRALGGDPRASQEAITEEELRSLVAGHQALGEDERELIDEVFAAARRQVREVMIPRTEVSFLAASLTVAAAREEVADQPHSRYPIVGASNDDILGFIHVRDLFTPGIDAPRTHLRRLARRVAMIPSTKPVLDALTEMRETQSHLVIVVDEYGGTDGIVTLEDLIEEVIGDIRDEYDDVTEGRAQLLAGGAVEVDGLLNLDEVEEQSGLSVPEGPYETLGGFMMSRLGRLPVVGDRIDCDDRVLEVTEMEGRRISRIRVTVMRPGR